MSDFTLEEMLAMQRSLQERYKHKWEPICPETGKNKMLWMIGEIGEVVDIVKKHGDEAAMSDPELRRALVEEMADVLMYYGDIMLCYDRIIEQAYEYGHSVYREFAFLVAHSILHLLGYDHMNEDDEKVMFKLQEMILNEYGIKKDN